MSEQTQEEVTEDRATMNAQMDAADGIVPEKKEAGKSEVKAEPTGDEAGKSAEPTDGVKSGEVDPNVAKAKEGTDPGVQKRFNEMTAKNSALKEDNAYWKGRAEAAEAAKVKGEPDQADEPENKEPVKTELDPDDFETFEEYEEARIENIADKRIAAKETKDQEAKTKATEAENVKVAHERTFDQGKRAAATREDFNEVVNASNENLNLLPQDTTQMVLDSDFGAEIAYQVGKDPELATRLAKMTPSQAIREVVALETPFKAIADKDNKGDEPPGGAPDITEKRVSGAPAPVGSLGSGGGVGKSDALSDKADIKEWMKERDNTAPY